jgi:hypothetical protein
MDGPVDDVLGAYEAFVQAQATEGHHPAAQ